MEIRANDQVMREKAASLKEIGAKITALANEMKTEIARLQTTWEGDAAELLVARFNELNNAFESRQQTINNYANFLTNAADNYQAVENSNRESLE